MSNSSSPIIDQTTLIAITGLFTAGAGAWAFATANMGFELHGSVPLAILLPTVGAVLTLWLARHHLMAPFIALFSDDGEDGSTSPPKKNPSGNWGGKPEGTPVSETDENDRDGEEHRRNQGEAHPDAPTDSTIPALEQDDSGGGTGNVPKAGAVTSDVEDTAGLTADSAAPATSVSIGKSNRSTVESGDDETFADSRDRSSEEPSEDSEDDGSPANPITERDIKRYGDRSPSGPY